MSKDDGIAFFIIGLLIVFMISLGIFIGWQLASSEDYSPLPISPTNIWSEFDRYIGNYANLTGEEVQVGNCKGKWVDIADSDSIQNQWFVGWDSGGQSVVMPNYFMNEQFHPEYFRDVILRSNISYGEVEDIIDKVADVWENNKKLDERFKQAGLQALIEVTQALRSSR